MSNLKLLEIIIDKNPRITNQNQLNIIWLSRLRYLLNLRNAKIAAGLLIDFQLTVAL